jgi:hypothetical protein
MCVGFLKKPVKEEGESDEWYAVAVKMILMDQWRFLLDLLNQYRDGVALSLPGDPPGTHSLVVPRVALLKGDYQEQEFLAGVDGSTYAVCGARIRTKGCMTQDDQHACLFQDCVRACVCVRACACVRVRACVCVPSSGCGCCVFVAWCVAADQPGYRDGDLRRALLRDHSLPLRDVVSGSMPTWYSCKAAVNAYKEGGWSPFIAPAFEDDAYVTLMGGFSLYQRMPLDHLHLVRGVVCERRCACPCVPVAAGSVGLARRRRACLSSDSRGAAAQGAVVPAAADSVLPGHLRHKERRRWWCGAHHVREEPRDCCCGAARASTVRRIAVCSRCCCVRALALQ